MPGQPGVHTAGPEAAPYFIGQLSAATGLDPKVVAAWVNAEGAYAPNGTGGNNFLNIRESTSRSGVPVVGTTSKGFAQFANAHDAATEAAYWINNMPNYAGIRRAARVGPKSQIAAIAGSPWDSGHYGGGKKLYDSYAAVTKPGFDWGAVASVIGDVIKVATPGGLASGAAGAVHDIPGLPGVNSIPGVKTATTILDAPQQIADAMGTVVTDVGWLFNAQHWLRIGYIMGGGIFVVGGLFILARSVGAGSALGGSSGPAAGAASVAAPELAAARVATEVERTKEVRSRRRRNLETSRETRSAREERERKAYFRGAADAGR